MYKFQNNDSARSKYAALLIFFFVFFQACLALGATDEAAQRLGERGRMYSRQDLRSTANAGGPEDWPENEGLSTSTIDTPAGVDNAPGLNISDYSPQTNINPQDENTQLPAPVGQAAPAGQPAPLPETRVTQGGNRVAGATATGNVGLPMGQQPEAEQAPAEREVIYVDEQGNPVPKPPEPDKMYAEAMAFIEQGKYDDALPILENIRQIPNIPNDLLEKTLYGISDCIWARYTDNPLAGYEPIVSSTNEALNANLRSARVPDALLRLGLANINVGNLGDASGYIVALMRRFPDYPGVAQGFTALGNAQLKDGKYADAERSFSIVLDKYPESSQLQAASVGLATALVKQNKDDRAQVILEFISKRWPRYYIKDPDFLLMQAANDEKLHHEDDAMNLYWLYVNIDPRREGNAPLLLKMADTYLKNNNPAAANYVYGEIENYFPNSPQAVTARLRMAEKGIHDSPIKYNDMTRVFAGGDSLWRVYNDLVNSGNTSEDAVLTRLKQAMWLLWDKQYPEAMGKAADFIDAYPEHRDAEEARNVLWEAFQKELQQSLDEHNYGRILLLWNGFPYIRERYGKMDAPLRYALAQGWRERGDEQKAFDLLADFLKDPMDPKYGEAAFTLFFNHYLQNGQWDKILDLGNMVKNWKMQPELQNQLDYALALSSQNLNLGAAALNRWKQLASRSDIPLYQRAYATYFLAKDAENRRDIRNAYEGNRKVIEMFTELQNERSDKADPERIKESIASLMDICEVGNRVPEALQWVERYNAFVTPESPEYPSVRFREARLYRKLGDNSRSQALLEDITKNYPQSPFAQAAAAELRTFDVSRDLQRYISSTPQSEPASAKGSTEGNWSSTRPAASAAQ